MYFQYISCEQPPTYYKYDIFYKKEKSHIKKREDVTLLSISLPCLPFESTFPQENPLSQIACDHPLHIQSILDPCS